MSDLTANQASEPRERPGLFDLVFPACFGVAAILFTALWFAAIGWVAWQPLHILLAWYFS